MDLAFIIIDDSELDCFIAEKMVRHTSKNFDVKSFTEASLALKYIEQQPAEALPEKTVILLDILMPLMNGFDFLKVFETFPHEVRNKYLTIAITSSLNKKDIEDIQKFQTVKGLIDKPITKESLTFLLEQNHLHWPKE